MKDFVDILRKLNGNNIEQNSQVKLMDQDRKFGIA